MLIALHVWLHYTVHRIVFTVLLFSHSHLHQGNFREDNFQKSMLLLQDEGAPSERKGRKGGIKGVSSCFKLVKMIMERNMQPVIVFSFSRNNCESFALELSKLDFNSGTCNWAVCSTLDVECVKDFHIVLYCICSCTIYGMLVRCKWNVCDAYEFPFNPAEEKSLVKEVFTNAIDCLSEDDKKLPQVCAMWHARCCVRCSMQSCSGACC